MKKYIFDGIKMVGLKDHNGQWWKVVKDCAQCGQCCLSVGNPWWFANEEGACKYLKLHEGGKYLCGLGSSRPFSCCISDPEGIEDFCTVVLEKIDDPSSLL